MGKTRTANFEVQIETESGSRLITGAMTKREALSKFKELATLMNSTQGYIWAQTAYGRKILKNADYIGLRLTKTGLEIYNGSLDNDSAIS